jgi:hypothetical protein
MSESALNVLSRFGSEFWPALLLLLDSAHFAKDAKQISWEFAVEVEDLRACGLSKSSIRWLVFKGYAEHGIETTKRNGKAGRRFRRSANLVFSGPSCMILSEAGVDFARGVQQSRSENLGRIATKSPLHPTWDRDSRTLRVRATIVKQFKVPAGNQEVILDAFQEEGWPSQIDDPLPPTSKVDAHRRLHDAINRLNRNQKNKLIRFTGNGKGRAICWKLLDDELPPE